MTCFRSLFLLSFLILTGSAQAQRLNPGGCLRPPSTWLSPLPALPAPQPPKAPAEAPKVSLPAFEAALVLKSKENTVKYERILDKKWQHVIEAKNFTVKIGVVSTLNRPTLTSYKILEVTVENSEGQRIAYQRQYAPSVEEMNNLVMEFLDPQSGDTYVVGVRSEAAFERLKKAEK